MSLRISPSRVRPLPSCCSNIPMANSGFPSPVAFADALLTSLDLDWPPEDTEGPGERGNTHLWEESWDDDDTSEDFSKQLK